jgi:hypothetical protein
VHTVAEDESKVDVKENAFRADHHIFPMTITSPLEQYDWKLIALETKRSLNLERKNVISLRQLGSEGYSLLQTRK